MPGIVVMGATPPGKKFPVEAIVERAIGMTDPYGNSFAIIVLKWTPYKRTTHRAKTAGFEEAVLNRTDDGIVITYRDGAAEWLKDGYVGGYTTMIPYTKRNIEMLASHHYDRLWTISSIKTDGTYNLVEIQKKVKKMADEFDQRNKAVQALDKEGKPTGETQYEFDKKRREAHFRGRTGDDIRRPVKGTIQELEMKGEKDEIKRQKADLKRREEQLKRKEVQAGVVEDDMFGNVIHTKESLENCTGEELHQIADYMSIKNHTAFRSHALIEKILETQDEKEPVR